MEGTRCPLGTVVSLVYLSTCDQGHQAMVVRRAPNYYFSLLQQRISNLRIIVRFPMTVQLD